MSADLGTKFTVDEETGELFTNKVFDREGDDGKSVSVTIKAIDSGEPSLEGVCSFTVEITDVNDNPPLFDRQKYIENVKQARIQLKKNFSLVNLIENELLFVFCLSFSLGEILNFPKCSVLTIQCKGLWIRIRPFSSEKIV